jgi:hypothetical protein
VPAAQLVGQVLRIPPRLARYLDEPITLRITRVREDISLWYDGDWIWLEGEQLDNHGRPLGPFQALVSVEAIPHGSR